MQPSLVNWIQATDRKIVIGISGHGAAGKTTFTHRLLDRLGNEDVNYLNTDPYIVSSDIRRHAAIDYTYENEDHRHRMTACHPAAHHLGALERDVRMAREGLDFYTIDVRYLKRELVSSNNRLTIVEGMSAAFIEPELFDLKIHFYTDGETELMRRSSRDIVERGANLDYLKQSHAQRRIQYELFMHPYSRNFDIVIKSAENEQIVEKLDFAFIS
ncbi:phosphoribulokinase [Planococcus salinarum]|uniref:Phosphoribulokinase n=1 Tax=Planococcus salinarum TaxID=622695 RepID=A0ABX3CV19_9BACL|nr:phosphoribulokinase [Planococcus salinarum]OHX49334.1 phosphoribulokinase [Planococcus salinarum]TAA73271.1 phosphoribulokinase [Planococcus salinarum]